VPRALMPSYETISKLLNEEAEEQQITHDIHACGISRTKFLQVGSFGSFLVVFFARESKNGLILALKDVENDLPVLILQLGERAINSSIRRKRMRREPSAICTTSAQVTSYEATVNHSLANE
jgi:hypothetical protein